MNGKSCNPHVLIIEDDQKTVQMLEVGLNARNIICSCATDGIEAFEIIKERVPDVILLDLSLPKLDGLEVCKRIKQDYSDVFIPIIILTARDDIQSKVNGLECGADDYITKPYNILEVVARINSMYRIKTLQDEVVAKNINLEELNRLKDEFLSICTHDLCNIIMPIREASSIMRDNLMPDTNIKFADIIHRQSQKMVDLLHSLLKSFQSEQGKLVLAPKQVNACSFFKQYASDCALLNEQTGIEIKYEINNSIKEWVFDPEKIDEVLTNLVTNAIKFTPRGGSITLIMDSYHNQGRDYLLMGVRDTGEGIPEDKLDTIFDKFVTSGSRKNKLGIGLGLSICRSIVEHHGGNIWVESVNGEGTTFYFILPKIEIPLAEQMERVS